MATSHKVIEAGVTVFSAAEIHVAVIAIGDVPEDILLRYMSLISRHRQVELSSFQSFYNASSKSPFKSFPWKSGSMHFRFLPEEVALKPNPLSVLHMHRRILGLIGVLHCPTTPDFARAYAQFEHMCRAFPEAFVLRCFAFEPSDAQVEVDTSAREHLIMFPPARSGGVQALEGHAEVVMCDFAACMLGELERWMLNASPAMVNLNTFADSSERFITPTSTLEEVSKRIYADEEIVRKKRYGRLQKAMGDISLLAGSPSDAYDHYITATELSQTSNDWVWRAAALEGTAQAKIMQECLSTGAIRNTKAFLGEMMPLAFQLTGALAQRVNRGSGSSPSTPTRGSARPAAGDAKSIASGASTGTPTGSRPLADPRIAQLQAAEAVSLDSRSSSQFGGQEFWSKLRGFEVEREVRGLFAEARMAARRKGALAMVVEESLQMARFLAGLDPHQFRGEVSELMSSMIEAGAGLLMPEDRLLVLMEAAQVTGLIGASRKRTLMLWQAVELSRSMERPSSATLAIARKALEPPDDPLEQEPKDQTLARRVPLQSGVPRHWGSVRCGCIEGVLGTAILAGQHADVWDAAAMLLRDHHRELPVTRQQSLWETLAAAASQMDARDKERPASGPPPLFTFMQPCPLEEHLRPQFLSLGQPKAGAAVAKQGPFIYSNLRSEEAQPQKQAAAKPQMLVCGEVARMQVAVENPTVLPVVIERMSLEAEHMGDPAVAPRDQQGRPNSPAWRAEPVKLELPPRQPPILVELSGTPLVKGFFVITGCRMSCMGVTWHQPWAPRPPTLGKRLAPALIRSMVDPAVAAADLGGKAQARVSVVQPLPLMQARLVTSSVAGTDVKAPEGAPAGAQRSSAASGSVSVVALRGEVLQWRLLAVNRGKMAVTHASLRTLDKVPPAEGGQGRPGESPAAFQQQVHQLPLQVSVAAAEQALPLPPATRMDIPLMLPTPPARGHGSELDAAASLVLEYASNPRPLDPALPARAGLAVDREQVPAEELLGRRLQLQAQVQLLPSLQVSAAAMWEEHFPPAASVPPSSQAVVERGSENQPQLLPHGLDAGSMAEPERRCVLEVEVVNRTDLVLQVWLGQKVVPAFDSPAWADVLSGKAAPLWQAPQRGQSPDRSRDQLHGNSADASAAEGSAEQGQHPGDSVAIPGRQRGAVCAAVELPSGALAAAAEALVAQSNATAHAKKGQGMRQRPDALFRTCAELIAESMTLFWRAERPGDRTSKGGCVAGFAALPPETIQRAITQQMLGLLVNAPLQLSCSVPAQQLGISQRLLQPPQGLPTDAAVGKGQVWGTRLDLGQPLDVHLLVKSQSQLDLVLLSVSCHSVAHPVNMLQFIDDPSVMLAGPTTGIKLTLDDAGCAQQKLQVCFLAPGMYVMYASQIQTQLRQAGASLVPAPNSVAVHLTLGFFEVS